MLWSLNVTSTEIALCHNIIAAFDKLKYLVCEKEIVQGGSNGRGISLHPS